MFDGSKGQIIWNKVDKKGTVDDYTLVQYDANGDRKADAQVELWGLHSLTKSDFIL
jgi:hypothetical protein